MSALSIELLEDLLYGTLFEDRLDLLPRAVILFLHLLATLQLLVFLRIHLEIELPKRVPLEVVEGDVYFLHFGLNLVNDSPEVLHSDLARFIALEEPELMFLFIEI